MQANLKPLLLVAALIAGGIASAAQPGAPAGQRHAALSHDGGMNVARMQERMASHMAKLRALLNLNAAQVPPWDNFLAAMQPPADMAQRMSREHRASMRQEIESLTTPQRIDRMNAMKVQRDARMAARQDATLALYVALTPDQQKVFDDNSMRGPRSIDHHDGGKGRPHG